MQPPSADPDDCIMHKTQSCYQWEKNVCGYKIYMHAIFIYIFYVLYMHDTHWKVLNISDRSNIACMYHTYTIANYIIVTDFCLTSVVHSIQ